MTQSCVRVRSFNSVTHAPPFFFNSFVFNLSQQHQYKPGLYNLRTHTHTSTHTHGLHRQVACMIGSACIMVCFRVHACVIAKSCKCRTHWTRWSVCVCMRVKVVGLKCSMICHDWWIVQLDVQKEQKEIRWQRTIKPCHCFCDDAQASKQPYYCSAHILWICFNASHPWT